MNSSFFLVILLFSRIENNSTCHQQDKKEKDVDGLGKRRKTSQSEDVSNSDSKASSSLVVISVCVGEDYLTNTDLINPTRRTETGEKTKVTWFGFPQEEVSRIGRDDRPSVPVILSERKMDSAAVGNHNKVKVMATQLLAKFEENAPAQPTGLKRQVWGERKSHGSFSTDERQYKKIKAKKY